MTNNRNEIFAPTESDKEFWAHRGILMEKLNHHEDTAAIYKFYTLVELMIFQCCGPQTPQHLDELYEMATRPGVDWDIADCYFQCNVDDDGNPCHHIINAFNL